MKPGLGHLLGGPEVGRVAAGGAAPDNHPL